ncbi:MAG: hypothetical protein VW397_08170, partial [Candidatus Margulisiibacteriota bacterium]
SYYDDPTEFSLVLKRVSDKLALYGDKHVVIRQNFFNHLSLSRRLALLFQKLTASNIEQWIFQTLNCTKADIINAIDVGKGRSIYKITTKQDKSFVIKQKSNINQQYFNELSSEFLMPAPKSFFTKINGVHWELTEFLDDQQVFHNKKDALIEPFARAAAFGDFIELGDRHFENYITRGKELVAIDVCHLMEPDNEHWTKKYISGGLYEVCILQYYMKDQSSFESGVDAFFRTYQDHAVHLFNLKNQVSINTPYIDKINQQWVSVGQFVQHMNHIYSEAIKEMFRRVCYKSLLTTLVKNDVSLEPYPILKMYYLADLNRISTFFRSEECSESIFDQIQQLSANHLGVTQQYFTDFLQTTKPILDCLENQLLQASPILK